MNPHMLPLLSAAATEGRVFGLDLQTLIQIGTMMFNLALLAFVFSRLLYKPVRKHLQKRADRIGEQVERAARDMEKANELKLEYEGKLREIEAERVSILDAARREARDEGVRLRAEAKKDADDTRERARQDVKMEWDRAQHEMKRTIIEVSAAIAEKYITRVMDEETGDRLFDEAMSELSAAVFSVAD